MAKQENETPEKVTKKTPASKQGKSKALSINVKVKALKGAPHMVAGDTYTIGKDLAKTLVGQKRAEFVK